MAGIATNIEHRLGAQQLHSVLDEFLLAQAFPFTVVIEADLVSTPARIAFAGLERMQGFCKFLEVAVQNRGCDLRRLLQARRRRRSALAALEQKRKRNQ